MPIDGFGSRNLLRLDFDSLTVYVSIFYNPAAIHPHAHEDLFSYAVYHGTREVLVDPGRPSYLPSDRKFTLAPVHNGLTDPQRPMRPRLRFFSGRALRAEPHAAGCVRRGGGAVEFWAQNRLFGVRSTLAIAPVDNGIRVAEALESKHTLQPLFIHNFPDREAVMVDARSARLPFSGIGISYDGAEGRIEPAERATDYGTRQEACRFVAAFPPSHRCEMAWTLRGPAS